jgi:carboxyl-terminal processing protease
MKRSFSRLFVLDIVAITLFIGLIAGIVLDRKVINAFIPPENIEKEAAPNFRLMAEAWNTIKTFYIHRGSVSDRKMTYGAIEGMVDSLGDKGHSRFMTPEMVRQVKNVVRGQFVGIGVELRIKDNEVTVLAPMDGSPAQEAGIRPGDIILKINDHDVGGLPLDQVVKLVQGPEGTTVDLTVKTPRTDMTREVKLKRRKLTIRNVTWHRLPGTNVAHLRISSFSRGTTRDLKKALTALLQKTDRPVDALILDLRNNPGGLLEEALGVTSQFIKNKTVVQVKNARNEIEKLSSEPEGLALTVPTVAIINTGTASAAEILAGALQDWSRAKLVGEKTVGTGTVLKEYSLGDGSALLLAAYEWLTASGRAIWHEGISPDIKVGLSPKAKPLFPSAGRNMTEAEFRATDDRQLLEALNVIEKEKDDLADGSVMLFEKQMDQPAEQSHDMMAEKVKQCSDYYAADKEHKERFVLAGPYRFPFQVQDKGPRKPSEYVH